MTWPHSQAPYKRVGARLHVLGVPADRRQRTAKRRDAVARHEVDHRVAVGRVQALGRMCDRIDAAGQAHGRRQAERQLGVVDHGARHHLGVLTGFLQAAFGDAVNRRHLRASVGGGNRDDGQARVQGNRLAQAGGRTAAYGHRAVGAELARHLAGFARGLDGHMHHGLIEDTR